MIQHHLVSDYKYIEHSKVDGDKASESKNVTYTKKQLAIVLSCFFCDQLIAFKWRIHSPIKTVNHSINDIFIVKNNIYLLLNDKINGMIQPINHY